MKLLLDTHVVFCALIEEKQLSAAARTLLEDERNEVFVSIASVSEIGIKVGLGKWPEAAPLLETIESSIGDAKFQFLPISW